MSLRRRRTRFPQRKNAITRKTSRERIIPPSLPAQTPVWHVNAVMLRGSLPIAAIGLPLAVISQASFSQALPFTALFLTAAHGSVLVHQSISRR